MPLTLSQLTRICGRWQRFFALLAAASTLMAMTAVAAAPAQAAPAAPAGTAAPPSQAGAPAGAIAHTGPDGQPITNPDQPPQGALSPADIQNAYHLPPTGQGQTVAVIETDDDPTAESDLAVFRSYYGLPACTTGNDCFRKVDAAGGTDSPPAADTTRALDTSLELDAVSAACPNCHLLLVEADYGDAYYNTPVDAIATAVKLGAKYISLDGNGTCSSPGESGDEVNQNPSYDIPGVVLTVGADPCFSSSPPVVFPASAPDVVAVGGTTLTRAPSTGRGWTETAWQEDESGCSDYEPKPAWQDRVTTGCLNRAVPDLSADANPNTGLAVYDSYGYSGWLQAGGSGLAAALVAGMYALAGPPAAGSWPVSHPYKDPDRDHGPDGVTDLNDTTTGRCGNPSCTAGPGWDGPTGLGTPNGVGALMSGPHGYITGQVTKSGHPVSGATVSVPGGYAATTGTGGTYTLTVPPGSYTLTASAFGDTSQSRTSVTVTANQAATAENFTLAAAPATTVSGTVTDGSGQGWPVYAKIIVRGDPQPVYTNPYTGKYSVHVPQGSMQQLSVIPLYPGYQTASLSVTASTTALTKDIKVTVDPATCDAPGYGWSYTGAHENFTGWAGTTPHDGWAITANNGSGTTWRFGAPSTPGTTVPPPPLDSNAGFAVAASYNTQAGTAVDTSLTSPVISLTGVSSPQISFDTGFNASQDHAGQVDLSLDGGKTWTTVWQRTWPATAPPGYQGRSVQGLVVIPVPQAAGQQDVRARFRYTGGSAGFWWSIGNVVIGARGCAATPGGLVVGTVTDANTGEPVDGAQATSATQSASGDTAVNGFYWVFTPASGSQRFTVTGPIGRGFTTATGNVMVVAGTLTRRNWQLTAGLSAQGSLSATAAMGSNVTRKIILTNRGTAPASLTLAAQNASAPPDVALSALTASPPANQHPALPTAARRSPAAVRATGRSVATVHRPAVTPASGAWVSIASYPHGAARNVPSGIYENAMATDPADGVVYSVGGYDEGGGSGYQLDTTDGYAYDPSSHRWGPIASLPQPRAGASAVFVNGKMYVVGGTSNSTSGASASVYAYDPGAGTWQQVAPLPQPLAAASAAVLGGQLYIIGGCTSGAVGGNLPCNVSSESAAVYRYNPGSNTWTQLTSYPTPVAFTGCAGLASEIACAGGASADAAGNPVVLTSTYLYHPSSNTWTKGADLPYHDYGMAAAGADGDLQIAGGGTQIVLGLTRRAEQYNPVTNTWEALPSTKFATQRGGGACGFYTVGGAAYADGGEAISPYAQMLPGYSQCGTGGGSVPWLSAHPATITLPPGQSATVTVTLNAGSTSVTQPGTYTARLVTESTIPYRQLSIPVTLHVTPPKTWGEISGTVTSARGKPLPGATVQIGTFDGTGQLTWTLATSASGRYQLWLDHRYNPLQVIAGDSGYQPQAKTVKITVGKATTQNFALRKRN